MENINGVAAIPGGASQTYGMNEALRTDPSGAALQSSFKPSQDTRTPQQIEENHARLVRENHAQVEAEKAFKAREEALYGTGPEARPTIDALVKKLRVQLKQAADLPKLIEGVKALREQQRIMDDHSVVITQQRVAECSTRYAQDPTPANFRALREAKTLEPADHMQVQQYAQQKREAILAQISPAILPIMTRAAELCQEAAEAHATSETATHAAYGVIVIGSPLGRGLHSLALEFRNVARAKVPLGGLPEIVEKLLALET